MTQEATVQDLFNQALEKSKADREERKNQNMGGGSSGGFERIEWLGLEDQVEKIFRPFGLPVEFRQKGSDPKLFYHSKVVTDKEDGYMNIVWKKTSDNLIDEDWLLYRLYSFVTKKQWINYEDGHTNDKGHTGEYKYMYESSDTFKRIEQNRKKDASPRSFPPPFKFKTRVAIQGIDPTNEWCKETKHSKVLTSKAALWKNDDNGNPIIFYDMGIPEMLYNKILDDVVAYRKDWWLYIVIKKNSKDLNNAYVVRDEFEDKLLPETKEMIQKAIELYGTGDSIKEEDYELYNFDEMKTFTTTSYIALRKRLGGLFKLFDVEFKQNYYDELEREVEKEQKQLAVEEQNQLEKEIDEVVESITEPEKNTLVVEQQESIVVNTSVENKSIEKSSEEDTFVTHFDNWSALKETEQKIMKSAIERFEGHVPIYKDAKNTLPCMDANCKFKDSEITTVFPTTVLTCPVCGKVDKTASV